MSCQFRSRNCGHSLSRLAQIGHNRAKQKGFPTVREGGLSGLVDTQALLPGIWGLITNKTRARSLLHHLISRWTRDCLVSWGGLVLITHLVLDIRLPGGMGWLAWLVIGGGSNAGLFQWISQVSQWGGEGWFN